MISFARGLVLRKGMRTFEFERDLGNGRVQFKYLDTFEVMTFQVGSLYKAILNGEVTQVHSSAAPSLPDESTALKLPAALNPKQEDLIAFRMRFVQAAIRARASAGSTRQLAEVIARLVNSGDGQAADGASKVDLKPPKPATLMGWLKRYRQSGGNPYLLCDMRAVAQKPNRISNDVESVVEEMIGKHYLQPRGKSMKATHTEVCRAIQQLNRRDGSDLKAPGERTVMRRIHQIPEYVRDTKRLGTAYARNKWRYSMKGDQSTRILERAEIDHTLLDVWVLDPRTGIPLGRPWITVVLDRFSGYVLGIYISFYGPSSGTVAKAIRCSILPKDELIEGIPEIEHHWSAMGVPETFVVDNGLEFHSRAFRRIGWHLRADIIYNPVRQPWLKASVERVMMEFNRILPNRGKVWAPIKNASSLDPSKSAAILFDDLCTCLLIWAAKVHPYQIHAKTLVRPIDLWEDSRHSSAPPMLPTDLTTLELATGISAERIISGDGVFFQYLRYNSAELQDYRRRHHQTFRTEIRFDPDDLGWMYVHLPKTDQWIRVELQRPSFEYGNGLSLLQHELIRKEAGQRLTRFNAEEVLLRAQADLQDRWSEATKRGIKVRKDADLVRAQGMSSARITKRDASSELAVPTPPEPSPAMMNLLPRAIPFKGYSLEEEDL